jgi:hypothetical protein
MNPLRLTEVRGLKSSSGRLDAVACEGVLEYLGMGFAGFSGLSGVVSSWVMLVCIFIDLKFKA